VCSICVCDDWRRVHQDSMKEINVQNQTRLWTESQRVTQTRCLSKDATASFVIIRLTLNLVPLNSGVGVYRTIEGDCTSILTLVQSISISWTNQTQVGILPKIFFSSIHRLHRRSPALPDAAIQQDTTTSKRCPQACGQPGTADGSVRDSLSSGTWEWLKAELWISRP